MSLEDVKIEIPQAGGGPSELPQTNGHSSTAGMLDRGRGLSPRSQASAEVVASGAEELALPLVFNAVCFSVKDKEILKNVHGSAEPGSLLALMGPTGSGKSTLLNLLAHRIKPTSGTISYGQYSWSKALKRHIGVVEQDDVVFPQLTVRQSLEFVAKLRLPGTMTDAERNQRVEEVIEQLRLTKCADTKIGDGLQRGISGGERKRTCIASEFITRPKVILFDEPTSGLDSTMAQMVVENMQTIAKAGTVVVSSIHQPSSQVFDKFKNILLLDAGEVIYFGTVAGCLEPFQQYGVKCPELYNPADFIMDVTVLKKISSDQRNELVQRFARYIAQPKELIKLQENKTERYSRTWYAQLGILCHRSFLIARDDLFELRTLILYTGLAVLAGLLWLDLGMDETDIYPRTTLALWIVGTWMFFPLFESLHFFPSRMLSLQKELYVNSYRLSAYFVAETSIALLNPIIWATYWVAVVYCFTLAPSGGFVDFLVLYLTIILQIIAMQGVGLGISAAIDEANAITFAMLLITFFFGYSGLFMPITNLPVWLSWTFYVNLLAYAYQLAMFIVFEFPGKDYYCSESTSSRFESCRVFNANESVLTIPPEEILDDINIIVAPWVSVVVLIGAAFVFRICSYQCLRRDTLRRK